VRQFTVGAKEEVKDDGSNSDEEDHILESLTKTDLDVVDLSPSFTKCGMHKHFWLIILAGQSSGILLGKSNQLYKSLP